MTQQPPFTAIFEGTHELLKNECNEENLSSVLGKKEQNQKRGEYSPAVLPSHCRGTKIRLSPECINTSGTWIAKAQRAAGKTEADREANRVIEETGLLVTETVERIQQKHYELSIENFKLQFKAKENEYSTITKLFDYHEAVERKNLRPGSYRGYIVTRKHLLDFVRIKFHLSDYSIEAIDKAFVYEFFAYLQGYRREGTVRCAVNGALKHIARFKRIMNLAIQNEWITNNPVCLLKVHKEYVEKGYLTEEEIRRLKAVTLPPHLGIARDIFMFSVYTGMAYVDILMLTNKNITLGIDGSHWLNYHRQKTSQRVAVPLLEPAEELIARYATYHGEKAKQPIFPVPCNQAINRYLKTIAKAAGIRKDITYHCFRYYLLSYQLKISSLYESLY